MVSATVSAISSPSFALSSSDSNSAYPAVPAVLIPEFPTVQQDDDMAPTLSTRRPTSVVGDAVRSIYERMSSRDRASVVVLPTHW